MSLQPATRMGSPLRRIIRRFRKNQDGATAVEFAMVGVPFLGLLFAIFETAFIFFVTEALESAVADSARLIMTNQIVVNQYSNADDFRQKVFCPASGTPKVTVPSFITCANLIVDIQALSSGTIDFSGYSGLSSTFYTSATKYCIGSGGDVVVMRVVYPMPVYLNLIAATQVGGAIRFSGGQVSFTSADGTSGMKHILTGTAVFRNEPYGTQAKAATC